jgi:hypothetical protein
VKSDIPPCETTDSFNIRFSPTDAHAPSGIAG